MADPAARSTWASLAAFATALLASAHHWLHVTLLALGFSFLAPLGDPLWRDAMLAISLAATTAITVWLLRSRDMPPARFWGFGTGACLSLALLALTLTRDGF